MTQGPTAVAVLTNPLSGQGAAKAAGARAITRFRERGLAVTELQGNSAAASVALARQAVADGAQALVCVGGDGLISAGIQAVAQSGVPIGVIPAGTGNDTAREFSIPTGDPEAAADVVVAGKTKTIDLARVGDAWFLTVLASGFDSKVTDRANSLTWPKGPMRYNVAILAELAGLRAIPYRIELDDETIEVDATLVSVGNTRSYGGGMRICPDAVVDDGLLDVTVVRHASRLRLAMLMPTIYKGTHVKLDTVDTYRSKRVRLTADGIKADADGEPLAPLPLTIEAVAAAATIFVPST
ncbi:diacylglycerol kinase [Antrihabitans cavernicola]|uniref:diacylglycerol kinase n=1 Tax=Antrihabitans cavernicola TaxID=2495913 RepID=UPI001F00E2EA|nr:diacylglycerol kinase [Spelaeibacter cavernicola]